MTSKPFSLISKHAFFPPLVAEQPDLSRLVISNITSDRFSLSWQTGQKTFDNFIVEVREAAAPSQAMGRTLSGDARSAVMAGLRASTQYNVKLYGSTGGQNTQPLYDVATTGTAVSLSKKSFQLFCLLAM